MMENQQLLADYVHRGSEAAFRELVARFINLVHSTALRLVSGDQDLAKDVTQTVFIHLAQNAGRLSPAVLLGGWLHRDTCYTASKMLRGERRRQARERQAALMQLPEDNSGDNLGQVRHLLDEAINRLDPEDRNAILLRFFEQRDFRSVGAILGSSEDAARMRVSRALDKLHATLKRQGVTLSAATLGTALAAQAVTAAPAGLALSVAATALGASTSATAISTTLLKAMTLTKLKAGLLGILIAGIGTPVLVQHHSQTKLRSQNQSLQEAHEGADGRSMKAYGFADGHSEYHNEADGNFERWEKQHSIARPTAGR